MDIIIREYEGLAVQFQSDVWFNATVVAKKFGKVPKDYLKVPRTTEYIMALAEQNSIGSLILYKQNQEVTKEIIEQITNNFVLVRQGGPDTGGGTWMHPDLGIDFARWLNPHFAVWCDRQIKELRYPSNKYVLEAQNEKLALESLKISLEAAKLLGMDEPMARAVAVNRITKVYKVDHFQKLLSNNVVEEVPVTPTILAGMVRKTVRWINKELEVNGFQVRADGKWELTNKGRQFGTSKPYQSQYSKHSGYQVVWYERVLAELGLKKVIRKRFKR